MNRLSAFLVFWVVVLAACNPITPSVATSTTEIDAGSVQPPATPKPSPPTEEPTEPPIETPFSLQPAAGQRVEFEAEDGVQLVGYFYPAVISNAPVVVLMHWAGGDQTDWTEIGMVQWLQNRLAENPIPPEQVGIFPPVPVGLSFAVFTFDFRDFGESQPFPGVSFMQIASGWLLDAKAAYKTAKEMLGVDPVRVAGFGSSIGADAVVDACIDATCLGTFSLSPGGYLQIPYENAVTDLSDEVWLTIPKAESLTAPIYCVASEMDIPSSRVCESVTTDPYRHIIFPGEVHGSLLLVAPTNPPEIGQVILDWLLYTFSLSE